jgi:PRTRC genetic system protein E
MFKELQPLLKNRSFVLIITAPNDTQINVNLIPKATSKDTEQDKALLIPLNIIGTPDELDAELPSLMNGYTQTHKSLAEQVEATKTAMKATADEAAAAAKDKAKGKTTATPAKKVEPAKPAPAAKPEAKKEESAPSLFDAPATETAAEEEPEEVFEP